MNLKRLLAVGLAAAILAVGLVATQGLSQEGRPKRKAKPQAAQPAPRTASAAAEEPSTAVLPSGLVTLRLRFGSKSDATGKRLPTQWDGQVQVIHGQLQNLRLWRDDPRDEVQGQRWTVSTRHSTPWNSEERKKGHEAMPVADTALLLDLTQTSPQTQIKLDTAQGQFEFTLEEVPWGAAKGFGGLLQVTRVATTRTILSAPTEDDYPSAALDRDGRLYVAYTAFTHGPDFRKRTALDEEPKSLDNLAQPTGGDQVLLLRLDGQQWTGPLPVTAPGEDVFRTALTIDGSGRVWVFWTAKRGAQWDLFARALQGERWADPVRLTSTPEPDLFAAATTDSEGRAWVAWQAFRGNNSDILAARQDGDKFAAPLVVAEGPGNQWAPAITASADGQVAVAWDSYTKGDYDVWCRIWSQGRLADPIPVTSDHKAQMRPSLAYDKAHRLWIAYEESPENWGKDWGALDKSGTGLYQGRSVAVRVWAEGQLWRTADDPAEAFALFRPAPAKPGKKAKPGPQPGAQAAKPGVGRGNKLAVPRLVTDAAGRVWLAVRSPVLGTRAPVGTFWYEHLVWFDGQRWSGQIVCPDTDNILDNRPALVAPPNGEVLLVASSDGRSTTAGRLPTWFTKELRGKGEKLKAEREQAKWPDPVNNELVMAAMGPAPGTLDRVQLLPVPVEKGQPSPEALKEADDVARCRAARTTLNGRTLRLLRGEFHRHTELSGDGGGDGMLMDMWRYAFDAAAMDWLGNGDHDNGDGREYSWWMVQKTTDLLTIPGFFSPMYTYERSVSYPDGHRNVVFAQRGVRTLPRLKTGMGKPLDDLPAAADRPNSPDTQLLYRYLQQFDGVCASHTSGTDMGTDWRDGNAKVEPIVEIYQGCRQNYEMPGAPRSNTAEYSIGGWRPLGFVSLALKKGFRLGFQSSSDHGSTHISFCNCWAEAPTREAILAAMKARHVYGATDHIVADVHCGPYFMGDEFTLKTKPVLSIRLHGTQPFAKVHVIKDGNYVHTAEPNQQQVELQWTDFDPKPGVTSYYYVRGEQTDGEMVWVSPMWITYQPH